jgi:hypothetical protein
MARHKTAAELVRARLALAKRLVVLRSEVYGDRGAPEVARLIGIPLRTWYNYEKGVTVPAEIILKIIEVTSVEAQWLIDRKGPRFRDTRANQCRTTSPNQIAVRDLLSTALNLLENCEPTGASLQAKSSASEGADSGPTAMGVSPLSQDLSAVQHVRWSQSSASDLGTRERAGCR